MPSSKQAHIDAKPKQDWNAITQLGLKAQALVTEHKAKLGDRLKTSFLTTFASDLTALGAVVPAARTARDGSVQLTAAQSSVVAAGYNLAKGVRTSVKGQHVDRDVLLAYGVGIRTNKFLVKDVKTALQKILDRAKAEPAEAEGFGISADDVAAITAQLALIDRVDQAQEVARATAPLTTKQRNSTAQRVLSGVKSIAGAGMRAFIHDATVFANFEALVRKVG